MKRLRHLLSCADRWLTSRPSFIVSLAIVGAGGLWLIDIGVVLLVNSIPLASNGWFQVEAMKLYHGGLYLVLGVLWMLAILALRK